MPPIDDNTLRQKARLVVARLEDNEEITLHDLVHALATENDLFGQIDGKRVIGIKDITTPAGTFPNISRKNRSGHYSFKYVSKKPETPNDPFNEI